MGDHRWTGSGGYGRPGGGPLEEGEEGVEAAAVVGAAGDVVVEQRRGVRRVEAVTGERGAEPLAQALAERALERAGDGDGETALAALQDVLGDHPAERL